MEVTSELRHIPEGKCLLDSVEGHRRSPLSPAGEVATPVPSSTVSRLAELDNVALKTKWWLLVGVAGQDMISSFCYETTRLIS